MKASHLTLKSLGSAREMSRIRYFVGHGYFFKVPHAYHCSWQNLYFLQHFFYVGPRPDREAHRE